MQVSGTRKWRDDTRVSGKKCRLIKSCVVGNISWNVAIKVQHINIAVEVVKRYFIFYLWIGHKVAIFLLNAPISANH